MPLHRSAGVISSVIAKFRRPPSVQRTRYPERGPEPRLFLLPAGLPHITRAGGRVFGTPRRRGSAKIQRHRLCELAVGALTHRGRCSGGHRESSNGSWVTGSRRGAGRVTWIVTPSVLLPLPGERAGYLDTVSVVPCCARTACSRSRATGVRCPSPCHSRSKALPHGVTGIVVTMWHQRQARPSVFWGPFEADGGRESRGCLGSGERA